MATDNVFFLFGAFRSGTTAFCHFLQASENGRISIEQAPKLGVEARALYESTLVDPRRVVRAARREEIEQSIQAGEVYADKNPNYLLFVPYLIEEFDCRFIFLHRDGRDVVRSMIDWHDVGGKTIFTLAEDGDVLSRKDGTEFPWDYSLLRPLPGMHLNQEWTNLSRFEKCAWYWSRYNDLAAQIMDEYEDGGRFLQLGLTKATPADIKLAYDFMGLRGFNEQHILSLMQARINSLSWNKAGSNRFPSKEDWDEQMKTDFERYAGATMRRLGYL